MERAWSESALSQLREASGRTGGARRGVIEFLDSQHCCVSAQEIHDGLRGTGVRVGVASVYRALDGLTQLGLVQRVELGDGVTRFEPTRPGGDHHHHLVCRGCGKVEPFEDAALESAIDRVALAHRYTVQAHDVVVHGACDDCRP